jgi:hypothetical protein
MPRRFRPLGCTRAHGVASFPDPDSSGRLGVRTIRAAGLGPAAPQLQAAMTACEQYRPGNIHVSRPAGGGS